MKISKSIQALLTTFLFTVETLPLLGSASPVPEAAAAPDAKANPLPIPAAIPNAAPEAVAAPGALADADTNALERRQLSRQYYLRVDVQHASRNVGRHSRFNGRYVQIYHTGAGTNDIALALNRSATRPGFLNGTYQQFDLRTPDIPWGLFMPTLVQYTRMCCLSRLRFYKEQTLFHPSKPDLRVATDIPYPLASEWQAPTIDAGYGYDYGAFFLDGNDRDALVWNTADEPGNPSANATTDMNAFGGWLACDWWHGVPQLFWKERYYTRSFTLPANCEEIKLRAEYI
ncbi:MAG: hypothetical protein M1831_006003 [Alyxoria varia]|nr:MAG: hypothetical protein M1831_006003 [Alyxoria varia]